jgi:hypothetical protein
LITGYSPVAGSNTSVVGVGAVSVASAGLVYTVSVATGSIDDPGVVRLAALGNLGGNENLIAGDDVITWDFLELWASTRTPPIV